MSVCIMFGLTGAAVLALIVTPVLYAIFFRIHEDTATTLRAQRMRQPVEVKGA
jgi:Cu/Ag efflux pump CusA